MRGTHASCLGSWAPPGASQPTKMSSAAVQSTALPRHCGRGCTLGRVGTSALRPMQLFFWWPASSKASANDERQPVGVMLGAADISIRHLTWSTQRVKSSSFSVSFETMH